MSSEFIVSCDESNHASFLMLLCNRVAKSKHCCPAISHFSDQIFFLSPNMIVFCFKMAQKIFLKKYFSSASRLLKGGPPPQHDLKFCQFVGASAKSLNIKYLLGWMRSRGDIRFTKFEKVVFSSYFEGSHKSNSYTVPYSYEAFGKNFVYRNLFTVFNSTG